MYLNFLPLLLPACLAAFTHSFLFFFSCLTLFIIQWEKLALLPIYFSVVFKVQNPSKVCYYPSFHGQCCLRRKQYVKLKPNVFCFLDDYNSCKQKKKYIISIFSYVVYQTCYNKQLYYFSSGVFTLTITWQNQTGLKF